MSKYLKFSFISLFAVMVVFVFSFSALQACAVIPGKACGSEPCKDEACPMKEAKAKLIKVSTSESGKTEEMVLNVTGMTCGACANVVKGALTACEGVTGAQVSHGDGKAVVQVEGGKANKEDLIKAVEKAGFSASEG